MEGDNLVLYYCTLNSISLKEEKTTRGNCTSDSIRNILQGLQVDLWWKAIETLSSWNRRVDRPPVRTGVCIS